MLKKIIKTTRFGSNRHQPYQSIDEIRGTRNMIHRYSVMKLPDNFFDKSVLDLGCNLGALCIESKRRMAGRVVGVDCKQAIIETASEFADFKKCKISFVCCNINNGLDCFIKEIGTEQFDYVFALSIWKHVIVKQNLRDVINYYCKDSCWFEGHNKQGYTFLKEELSNLWFSKIEFLGNTIDRGTRANILLTNKNNHKIDFENRTIKNIRLYKEKIKIKFDVDEYSQCNSSNAELGEYSFGNFSIFFHANYDVGYKVFVSFDKTWIEYADFHSCSINKILELNKIYNILFDAGIAPQVYKIFSVDMYFNNNKDYRRAYGLEMERITRQDKDFTEIEKRDFIFKLYECCKNNEIIRLSQSPRKLMSHGQKVTGSIRHIIKETIKCPLNYIYSKNGFKVIDIDVMWAINKGMTKRIFSF